MSRRASLSTQVRPRMGTLLALTAPAHGRPGGRAERVFAAVARWERVMSRHDPRSPVSAVNRAAGGAEVISPDLARVLRQARALARRTGGCFDPTMGPLVDLWQRAGRRGVAPAARALAAARARSGWEALRVRGNRVALARRGMSLDLGALGKGFALDEIRRALRGRGPSGLLNFGESSLVPLGPASGRGWTVMIRHPWGGFVGAVQLRRRACSTSGAHGQTVTVAGRWRSHVVDPRSGRPLRRRAQVTVLAPSAAVAEAVSTAMLVAGRDAMPGLARRFGVDACWVERTVVVTTRGFHLHRLEGALPPASRG
jgi:thiamine biosynthesis lipoprotein